MYSTQFIRGQRHHGADADADVGVLDGLHIGATWRIRLNRPCAAAMQHLSNYFDHGRSENRRQPQITAGHIVLDGDSA